MDHLRIQAHVAQCNAAEYYKQSRLARLEGRLVAARRMQERAAMYAADARAYLGVTE